MRNHLRTYLCIDLCIDLFICLFVHLSAIYATRQVAVPPATLLPAPLAPLHLPAVPHDSHHVTWYPAARKILSFPFFPFLRFFPLSSLFSLSLVSSNFHHSTFFSSQSVLDTPCFTFLLSPPTTTLHKSNRTAMLARSPATQSAVRRANVARIFAARSVSSTPETTPFAWADFFKLRKQERKIDVGSSIVSAFLACNVSWSYVSTMQIDPTQTLFGFDPLVVVSAGMIASGGLGYLFGPLLGSSIFKLKNKGHLDNYNTKSRVFLSHIKANRVDASSQSFSNPVPDYYGERIGSLREYRQWLRDCHAYRRKAKEFV